MAHTNSTPNYNLPQFLGTDKPAWLTDINNAMSDIDTAIAAAKTTADSADAAVSSLAITVGNHTSQLSTLSGAVTSQGNTLNTVTALIGNGTPTTTDQTIIGAINELAAIVEAGYVEVTADGVKTTADLLNALFALVDIAKVTVKSVYAEINAAGREIGFVLTSKESTALTFSRSVSNSARSTITNVTMNANASQEESVASNVSDNSVVYSSSSATVVTSGTKYRLYY